MEKDDCTITESELKTIQRLKNAWSCILTPEYLDQCKTSASTEGNGMSVFRFLRPSSSVTHNCEYFYAEKDSMPWDMLFYHFENKETLLQKYDSSSMFMVCVSIPQYEAGDDTIQEIKLFSNYDGSEIDY